VIGESECNDNGKSARRGSASFRFLLGREASPSNLPARWNLAPQIEQPVFHFAAIVILDPRIADLPKQRFEPRLERRAALRRIDRVLGALAQPQHVDQRTGLIEACSEGASALAPDKIIGVRALRQEREAEGMAFTQDR
jgi:hypothetical protein